PTKAPARKPGPRIALKSLRKISARAAVARLIRTRLKASGEISCSTAALIRTKVEPQMNVTTTRRRCAFNVRDTRSMRLVHCPSANYRAEDPGPEYFRSWYFGEIAIQDYKIGKLAWLNCSL